jgi:hypothetical protein
MADSKNTMWCKRCRQDVPALPSGDQQKLCCPRCGEAICADTPKTADQSPQYDGWEIDEQLRHMERVLKTAEVKGREADAAYRREASRFDRPQTGPTGWHTPSARPPGRQRKASSPERGSIFAAFSWLVLSLGTTGFVCGGILLGWSLATGRQELWTIGLPVALVSQIALLVGLVLQLERLWNDNREAAAKLDSVDEQLHELKATTTLLGTSQGPAASVFYTHFAGGAGPQLLLTDLKSQLDLLAMKIAQEER